MDHYETRTSADLTQIGGPDLETGVASQDLKYKGEDTWVEVGDTTVIREYCTINRGTQATGKTSVGQR